MYLRNSHTINNMMETKYFSLLQTLTARYTLLLALGLLLAGVPKAFSQVTSPAKNAGTGTNVTGVGTVAWTNPGNAISAETPTALYATAAVSGGAISNYLQATNYGFSIPPEATITGITVTIGRFENSTNTGNDVRDYIVRLIKGGTLVGDNDAVTGTDWPTTETPATYNGLTNALWNTTWTAADINAANFGVALAVNSTNNRTASVNYIQISVTYTGTYKSQFISMNTGSSTWCAGETRDITVTIKNNGTLTWTDSWPDINVGVKWNTNSTNWADYHVRTDAGNLAPGATKTYTIPVTASNNAGAGYTTPLSAGSNNLTFDLVYEGLSWFAGNGGGVGPGNVVYASPTITIISGVPAQPGTITGSAASCVGSTQTYSVTNVSGVTYNWIFPAGWTQTGGGTTNSVTATVGSGSGNVQVTPSNACGNGTARTMGVTVNLPTVDAGGAIAAICQGGTTTALGGSFGGTATAAVWSDGGAGGTFANNGGSAPNTATYTASASSASPVTLTLTTSGGSCGTVSGDKQITINSRPTVSATKTDISCFGAGNGQIVVTGANGTSPYTYSIYNGVAHSPYLDYQSGNAFTGLAPGQYKIRVKDSNQCESILIP